MNGARQIALALVLGLAFPLGLRAEDPESQPATQPTSQAASQPTTQPASQPADEEEKKPADRYLVVTNANVHTVSGPDMPDTTIVCKNGKIASLGADVTIPEPGDRADVEFLDAQGRHVYPGLIAAQSTGILGAAPSKDSTNLYSLYMTIALAGGLTTAVTGNSAAKLTYGTLEDHVLKDNLFVRLRYTTDSPDGRRTLRRDLDKVRQYIRDLEKHEQEKAKDPEAKEPDKEWLKGKFKEYYALLRGERTAYLEANSAHEITQACRLAQQYNFRLVIRGAVEGWTVAGLMSRAKVSAIVTPRQRRSEDRKLNRPTGWSITNAARLHRYGVPLAIVPPTPSITLWGVAGRDLLHLNMEAAFAVRGGLSSQAALEAVTLGPARILGIDHRVGSIEPGKDADLIICDGDILHYLTQVHHTIVNGRIVYDKTKDTLFSHIRPEGELEAPPPDDYWPRRLGANLDADGQLTK